MSARVSVIMRSKNSAWVIDQALKALFSQHYRDFELFVVDSGSTDNTLEMVKAYPCQLRCIEAKSYYPGAVLNEAIEQTPGELVVFVNSDAVLLSPHSLTRLVAAFDDPAVMAAFGRQLYRPEADGWVKRDYVASFPEEGEAPPWMKMSLPFAAMRRCAWDQLKFYTDAWGSEDTDWGNKARENGWKVAYVPDAILMHSHNYTLKQLYGRRFIEGEADAFIYHDHDSVPKMVKRVISSTLRDGWHHLRAADIGGLLAIVPRRSVYQWAYYKGHLLGETRIRENDTDTSKGQDVVLERQ